MSKRPVNSNWFMQLQTTGLKEHLKWLTQLSASVESIANFGCWSNESFALMWTLDATKVTVIEKKKEHLTALKEKLETLKKTNPGCLEGRSVELIAADMSTKVAELPCDHFNLAYCEDVLYYMESDLQKVQSAINEMARVVKPGGWIIAVEPKIGAEFENIPRKFFGDKVSTPVRVSDPIDIGQFFEAAGLVRVNIDSAPDWSYCYKKPHDQNSASAPSPLTVYELYGLTGRRGS